MPEGDFHYYAKHELHELLSAHPACRECKLERTIGAVRPDISLYINNVPIAIELQHSSISVEEIRERTDKYTEQGMNVFWLVLEGLGDPDIYSQVDRDKYAPSIWERYLHAMYFGRVYYYHKGLEVMPIHFDPHFIHVPVREWFDYEGNEHSAGGYEKRSGRYRVLNEGRRLHLVKDFRATLRKEWIPGTRLYVPPCRIWIDRGASGGSPCPCVTRRVCAIEF
jgi:competence protein CoiA